MDAEDEADPDTAVVHTEYGMAVVHIRDDGVEAHLPGGRTVRVSRE